MTEGLKERPALLRRPPRPAPDDKVDPVDYSPAPAVAPEQPAQAESGGVVDAETAPAAEAEPTPDPAAPPVTRETLPTPAPAPVTRPAPKASKAAKSAGNRKVSRREVTFPLSTRVSQEVLDILYTAVEEEGISVREVIEQGIRSRWG